MAHFFVPPDNIDNGKIILTGPETRHIGLVLRKKPGDKVIFFDGKGCKYRVVLDEVVNGFIAGTILETIKDEMSTSMKIELYQAALKSEMFDLIVQKCTELGISGITPVLTRRTLIKDRARITQRLSRWRKIALQACKQSERSVLPGIREVHTFEQVLKAKKPGEDGIILWESEKKMTLKRYMSGLNMKNGTLKLLVGPEGGFSKEEICLAEKNGFISVGINPAILRSETAAISLVSILVYEMES